MVCSAATPLVALVAVEGGEVYLLQRVEDEEDEVVLGKPVGDRRQEQVELVTLGGEEVVGHDVIVALGPLQVVDLTRALPGTSQIVSRGSCNRLSYRRRHISATTSGGRRLLRFEPPGSPCARRRKATGSTQPAGR